MIRDIARWVVLGGIFILPFLPLFVANSLFFPFITGKNFAFRIIVEVIFAAWIVLACLDTRYRPRFSWILGGFGALLVVMAFANALGENPLKSFFSNYERMEGYVTLVHLAMYFVVAGTVLSTERLWRNFLNTSVFVAVCMMLYGFCQLSGNPSCPISQSDYRIDGRMGNAAYLAIYMLFHAFIAAYLLVGTRVRAHKVIYGLLVIGFIFTLIQTGTRGTGLALVGGALIAGLYIALFEKRNPWVRHVAIGIVGVVIVIVGALYTLRGTPYVQNLGIINRMVSISLEEGSTRFTIWSLALEGVKERPLLGWGQENFNYVFNKEYKPSLYAQEPWFDRVHNLVLDWLVAGGILGFAAYLSILLSAVYFASIHPLFKRDEEPAFSVAERGILLGLLAGYTAHNLLVFDNLISYFLFATVLALIHTRIARPIPQIEQKQISTDVAINIVAPSVGVVLVLVCYFVNMQNIAAASSIIKAFQASSPTTQMNTFRDALRESNFADQEIREQLVRVAQQVFQDQGLAERLRQNNRNLTPETAQEQVAKIRNDYFVFAENELNKQVALTPHDARILVFQASFYRITGQPEKALPVLEKALTYSPQKQQIMFEKGFVHIQLRQFAEAEEVFKKAFELEESNIQARMLYASALIYGGKDDLVDELITEEFKSAYLENEFVLRALYETKKIPEVIELLNHRIEKNPNDLQMRVSKAAMEREVGNTAAAIKALEDAIAVFPDFAARGNQYINELRAGNIPTN